MIAGLDRNALWAEVTLGPRAALVPLPESRIIERPGWWQVITPSLTRGGLNEVVCSTLPEDEADAIIDQTLASYRQLGIERFRWTVGVVTEPADLGERLMQRGLSRVESLAMARATTGTTPPLAPITVEQVDVEQVASFTAVMAEGWDADPVQLDVLHRRMLGEATGRNHLFLARHAGVPAAAAGSVDLDRAVYLMGAVVLPRFRGVGLYRALVQARLAHGAARGFAAGVSVARAETSAPVLQRLGFQVVAPMVSFASE